MKKNGLIDEIIPEPLGGAHYDQETTFETVRKVIIDSYHKLSKKSAAQLINDRIEKYSAMGEYSE